VVGKAMRNLSEYLGIEKEVLEKTYSRRPANLGEMLNRSCLNHPDKIALVEENRRISYRNLSALVEKFSYTLRCSYKVRKGDRIAILLPNSIDYAVCYLAAVKTGALAVSLNTRCSAAELHFMIEDAEPKVLIVNHDLFFNIEPFAKKYFSPENIIFSDQTKINDSSPLLSEILSDATPCVEELPKIDESDIAGLMYTSGTTGRPKGAKISHGNIIANSIVLSFVYLCSENDIDLILAPLFHATGLYGQLLRSIYMGSTCVIPHKFQAIDAMQVIEKEKINVCVAVPTIFWLIMVHCDFNKFNLSSLRRIVYGGSPASESFVIQIASNFPKALQINAYGLTECTSVATALPPSECLTKIGSIGLPVPFSEIEIIDPTRHILPPGEIGELIIRGPQVCQSYWKNTNSTSSTFHGGWLHTGDLAKKDSEGFIYLMDRKKDMIIRGGENIYSVEVENALYNHPKVLEAAVVGVPDKIFGEQVKACIVLKSGEVSDADDIRSFCRLYLADYKIPKFIEFLNTLPRNPAGKVIKEKLL